MGNNGVNGCRLQCYGNITTELHEIGCWTLDRLRYQISRVGLASDFRPHSPKHLCLFNCVVESLVGVGGWALEFVGNAA